MFFRRLFLFFVLSTPIYAHLPKDVTEDELHATISSLTLEQKIGQLFISFFHGKTLDEQTRKFIEKSSLGNFIYFRWANELSNPSEVRKLSEELFSFVSKTTSLPPLICLDQEGSIARLQKGFSQFPGNMALAATQEEELAYKVGQTIGKELFSCGITLNLAPVVDIISNPHIPSVGIRSFGSSPKKVTLFTQKMIEGFHDAKIAVTLKHFPGYGEAHVNPHLSLPILDKPFSQMQLEELVPYTALKNEADCIMTAHVLYPSLDPQNCASLSHKILTDILRNHLKYKGVIVSDSLMMRGISQEQSSFDEAVLSVSKAAQKAFLAGCDLMIVAKLEWADFSTTREQDETLIEKVVEQFKQAVLEGKITEKRIDESLQRILRLKAQYAQGISQEQEIVPNDALSLEIATRSLTLFPSEKMWEEVNSSLTKRNWTLVASSEIKPNITSCLREKLPSSALFFSPDELKKDFSSLAQRAKKTISSSDVALFFCSNAFLSKEEGALLSLLTKEFGKEKLLLVATKNPQDVFAHRDHLAILTYSNSPISLKALFWALEKRERPSGKMPIRHSLQEN